MRTIDASVQTRASAPEQMAALLVAVAGWGGATVRWSGTGEDIEWPVGSGTVYDGRPVRINALPSARGGQVEIAVANHDLAVTKLLTTDPAGAVVTVTRLWYDPATLAPDAAEVLADGAVVQGYEVGDWVTLRAALPSAAERKAPTRLFDRICQWEFKGPECGYAGAETSCDHTDERCVALGNFANFGGFLLLLPREWV